MVVFIELFLVIFFILIALSFSPVGKVIAESYFSKKQNDDLFKRYQDLHDKFLEHEEELQKLREIIIFNEDRIKKIESKDSTNSSYDLNKKNIQNKKELN